MAGGIGGRRPGRDSRRGGRDAAAPRGVVAKLATARLRNGARQGEVEQPRPITSRAGLLACQRPHACSGTRAGMLACQTAERLVIH